MATTIRNVITAEITPFARKKRGKKNPVHETALAWDIFS